MNQKNFKCYCEHENGREMNKGIMCGLVEQKNESVIGDFRMIGQCPNYDDWCIRPNHITEAVQGVDMGKHDLCAKGTSLVMK